MTCVIPKERGDDPDSEKRTLRERVSKLESLIESLTRRKDGDVEESLAREVDAPNVPDDGLDDELMEVTRGAPLIAALEASEILSTRIVGSNNDYGNRRFHTFKAVPENSTNLCNELRSAIPPYEELRATFSGDTRWWDTWHMKTFGTNVVLETLPQFLDRAYWTGTVTELGFIISALGRQSPAEALRYLSIVDALILANDDHGGTLDGLLLTVFHGKVYLDIGRPHQGFLCNRRGISLAQIMNLHRNYPRSPKRSVIWWTMYLGDRFLSILLGLPYAISDDHFTVTITDHPDQVGHECRPFAIQVAILMGQVIDQVQSSGGPILSKVMNIEDKLETLASTKPRTWWKYLVPTVADTATKNDLRERLICQTQYYLTKIYLHLPYLLRSPSSPLYTTSRMVAVDSARGLVLRHHALRSYIDTEPVFDCQSIDFVGFMGAVVLLLGTSHDSRNPLPTDVELISKSVQLLQDLATIKASELAHQCASTLTALLALRIPSMRHDLPNPSEIRIPYFGVLRVNSRSSCLAAPYPTTPDDLGVKEISSMSASNGVDPQSSLPGTPTITYQGLYNYCDMNWTQNELCTMPDSLEFGSTLDQDWESFLNYGSQ